MGQSFNLVTGKWLPVMRHDGTVQKVGVREALTEAGEIRSVALSNPMDRLAVVRFLLALLYWCKGSPREAVGGNRGEIVTSTDVERILGASASFELLGDGPRFYQSVAPTTGRRPEALPSTYLIHEVPTGTNKWHFRHSTDGVDGLCPSCCALGLLRLPLFATSGGRGKPPGVNAKPPLYAVPVGRTLAATLRMSWRPVTTMGAPSWDSPGAPLPVADQVPLLVGMTWLPRRVWLGDPEAAGVCVSCGERAPLIRETVFAGVGSMRSDDEQPAHAWRDPHVIYVRDRKGVIMSLHAADALGASDAACGQWAAIVAALARGHDELGVALRAAADAAVEKDARLWIVGFSTVQNDKYLEATEHTMPISALKVAVGEAQERFERWQRTDSLSRKVGQLPGEKKSSRKHVNAQSLLASVRPQVEGRVATRAEELVTGDDGVWARAAGEYRPMMEVVARALSPGYTVAALQRRQEIARAGPRTGAEEAKVRRKKGGGA